MSPKQSIKIADSSDCLNDAEEFSLLVGKERVGIFQSKNLLFEQLYLVICRFSVNAAFASWLLSLHSINAIATFATFDSVVHLWRQSVGQINTVESLVEHPVRTSQLKEPLQLSQSLLTLLRERLLL
jgi:hypothetical protein